MSGNNWSLADRFVFVVNELRKIDADVDNENPHRYPLRKMKQTAETLLFEALATANDIADTAQILKDEMRSNV